MSRPEQGLREQDPREQQLFTELSIRNHQCQHAEAAADSARALLFGVAAAALLVAGLLIAHAFGMDMNEHQRSTARCLLGGLTAATAALILWTRARAHREVRSRRALSEALHRHFLHITASTEGRKD